MPSSNEDIIKFIREFEIASREYLLAKGMTENEIANAHLEMQWKFLKYIMRAREKAGRRFNINYLREINFTA